MATPDQLTVHVGVETAARTAAAAMADNSTRATELIAALRAAGVAAADVQTSNLSVFPEYDDKGRFITGYRVSNSVTATVRDLSRASDLLDAAASAAGDALRINGLSFSLADMAPRLAEARAAAVADARLRAEQLATAAGVTLGRLRHMSDLPGAHERDPMSARSMMAAGAYGTPVEAGSQEICAEVELVYDIAD